MPGDTAMTGMGTYPLVRKACLRIEGDEGVLAGEYNAAPAFGRNLGPDFLQKPRGQSLVAKAGVRAYAEKTRVAIVLAVDLRGGKAA